MTKLLLLIAVLNTALFAQESSEWSQVTTTLEEILVEDQLYRGMMDSVESAYGWESDEMQTLWQLQHEADSTNYAILEEIIAEHGWPKMSLVGERAAMAAFLVVQHAELEAQKKYFPLLKAAADNSEAEASDVAMLQDRILMRDGLPQIYGTQLTSNPESGQMEFWEIEDEANVNKRRADVGLGPLEEYAEYFGLDYKLPEANKKLPEANKTNR